MGPNAVSGLFFLQLNQHIPQQEHVVLVDLLDREVLGLFGRLDLQKPLLAPLYRRGGPWDLVVGVQPLLQHLAGTGILQAQLAAPGGQLVVACRLDIFGQCLTDQVCSGGRFLLRSLLLGGDRLLFLGQAW